MTARGGFLFCDGGARGNPGPAGAGAVLYDEAGKQVDAGRKYLGRATNNVAEYHGVLIGLELAHKHRLQRVSLRLDSELVVRQLTGVYRVKHPDLLPLWEQVRTRLKSFAAWDAEHIPRAENAAADRLVNEAIDQQRG